MLWSSYITQTHTNLDLREVEDLWEHTDMVGVGDEGVQSLAAGHSGGDRFQLVPTQIQLLQYLQFTEFAENITRVIYTDIIIDLFWMM